MAGDDKTRTQQNADRVVEWLLQHRTEFESDGIQEQGLAVAVGLSEDEIRQAIDYLENHDDVARLPQGLNDPPRFLLKPARGWPVIVDRRGREKSDRAKV
jgi:hypothetical protein